MVTQNLLKLITFCLILLTNSLFSQDLVISKSATADLTKTTRKGMLYGGTLIKGDEAKVFYVSSTKEEGAQVEEYILNLSGGSGSVEDKFIKTEEAQTQLPWFIPKSRVEKLAPVNGKWLKAGSAFGSGMKLWRGSIKKQYTLGIYTGMQFIEEESIKPKTGDIWRITPGGYKSLSDLNALATENGFYRDLQYYGNPLLMPATSTLLAAGVITEKISLKKNQKYAANRVAVLTMNGMNFDDMEYEIYTLPYTALTVGSGLGQDWNLCSVFAPLNGPTNVKSLKHLYGKDRKDQFTYMRFSDDRKLVDTTTFTSKMMWGQYQVLNGQESTFIFGIGNADFEGWFRGLEYKKVTGIQVTKIRDGELIYNKMFNDDELKSKIVTAGGKNTKFSIEKKHNYIHEVIDLPDGDALIIGQTPMEIYMLQLSSSGDLKAFYLLPLGKRDKIPVMSYQYMMKDGELILVVNLQPIEFRTNAQVERKTNNLGSGSSITTTTVKKLNEVFMQSMVYRITPASPKISNALACM